MGCSLWYSSYEYCFIVVEYTSVIFCLECVIVYFCFFHGVFFKGEDGIRGVVRSRGKGEG